MDINYYGYEEENKLKSKHIAIIKKLSFLALAIGILTTGCISLPGIPGANNNAPDSNIPVANEAQNNIDRNQGSSVIEVPGENEIEETNLVNYNLVAVGRSDPFMPIGEVEAYEDARQAGITEANEYNAKIAKLNSLKYTAIRLPEDTNPYSYNLPVPPTSLASPDAAASKISRTKVVGIMYNKANPSAIINIDDKDYLVRQGDKILDEKYKVLQINQSWITVTLGSNTYSAGIGELFSKDDLNRTKNDLYNLENRFGGRKG